MSSDAAVHDADRRIRPALAATRRQLIVSLVIAILPGLSLSLIGLTHPMYLTDDSAMQWRGLHVVTLPLFPLLALAPWWIARTHSPVLAVVTGLLGYVFAAGYTALDVLAGIGAGGLQLDNGGSGKGVLYDLADALATPGTIALLLAAMIAASVVLFRARSTRARLLGVLGGVLVVLAAISFVDSHIYWPRGGLTMLAFAVGWALLVLAERPRASEPAA
ncbi:hypothetical protein [Naasia lichenicola]|uniref:hypothetical protein n=1 Tax=Naasia lichenicola TaxID=2565933 RepID=UPI00130E0623|nr:hypothetical protein [Naasia lichenicola]